MATAPLPTRHDEAWRYSAVEALAQRGVPDWQALVVGAGETVSDSLIVSDAAPILRRRVEVAAGGHYALFAVNAAGALGRVELEVTLGEGARFTLGAVTLGGGDSVREIVTRVIHAAPGGTSEQVVRAVHWGQGAGNFLGTVAVARGAQKTDAAQSFKGLLLERGAAAHAVPQLEIYADDVKCAHGATVGQLDEAAAFYLAARGIGPDAARRLLVEAFIGDAFGDLPDDAARETLTGAALAALPGAPR